MEESPPKDLDKVGVYGFVTYDESGESVLANNPDKRQANYASQICNDES